ncbi:hypothetical protein GWK47_047835 [Chionoecetes opilio]|uniref:Uncharacterized protein n=1 Tax=Chionoecetes opilio TaxID=41210 RepID=A0A8J5CSJ2_CHIOP|nr:hypothetical protein GWK47_047835 [Chionoecetes opilio]
MLGSIHLTHIDKVLQRIRSGCEQYHIINIAREACVSPGSCWGHAKPKVKGVTRCQLVSQGLGTKLVLMDLQSPETQLELAWCPPHLSASGPTRTTTRSPLKEGLPRGTVRLTNKLIPAWYLPPSLPAKTKHSLASTHYALYQRLVEGVDVVMVPTVQTCILEATNPDRIYGNATQQLCHYTTILLSLPLVPKIPLNPCCIILPDLCQSREPINFEIHQERKMV